MKDSILVLVLGVLIGIGIYWFATHHHSSTTYSNVEEWEIVKDERGRTVGIRVHRRAEES